MRYSNTHKKEVREKLLASSRAIAKRGGFDSTGVDALMGAIGLTGGAFYSHFPSKQALFEALISEEVENSASKATGSNARNKAKAGRRSKVAASSRASNNARALTALTTGTGIKARALLRRKGVVS